MSQFESVNDYISFMKAHPNMTCPIKHTLDIIGGKWKLFIVLQLFGSEQLRFSQLSKNIPGITNTVLSGCLRDMERDGILLRHQFNEIPPHVEYSLTEKGRTLSRRIKHEYFLNAKRTCEKFTRPLFININLSDY